MLQSHLRFIFETYSFRIQLADGAIKKKASTLKPDGRTLISVTIQQQMAL